MKSFTGGRKRPSEFAHRLHLKKYLTKEGLSIPFPSVQDYTAKASKSLGDLYLNDELGDCVIAGYYHIKGVETGNAGNLFVASSDQIIADYSDIGGYKPGDDSTDQGCDEVTALNYWMNHGDQAGTKIAAWLNVDGSNLKELCLALYLFENLYFGIELPDEWASHMPEESGFIWDVAGDPVPDNGHCVMGAGYDEKGITVCSWGMLGKLTFPAIAKYGVPAAGGEVHVIVTPDQLAKGMAKAPNGMAWSDLINDANLMKS